MNDQGNKSLTQTLNDEKKQSFFDFVDQRARRDGEDPYLDEAPDALEARPRARPRVRDVGARRRDEADEGECEEHAGSHEAAHTHTQKENKLFAEQHRQRQRCVF